jgi:hypothetical protein
MFIANQAKRHVSSNHNKNYEDSSSLAVGSAECRKPKATLREKQKEFIVYTSKLCIHLLIYNLIHTFEIYSKYVDKKTTA